MTSQTEFRRALLDPSAPAPDGLHNGAGLPVGKRYDVYRNNVTHSLTEALRTAFPLVCKLIGSAHFDRLGSLYVRAHPPTSPLMMFYGSDFPEFIAAFEPLSGIGYLPDAARLDLALRHSYHAADQPPLDPGVFQRIAPDQLPLITLSLCPATQILRSRWPLHDIWRFNFEPSAPKPRAIAQDVMITRSDYDPVSHALPDGAADWLGHLSQGLKLGDATDATLARHPDFDLSTTLALMLKTTAFAQPNDKDMP